MIAQIRRWWSRRVEKRALEGLHLGAEKAAVALDIMLADREWYGGVRVNEERNVPFVEVLIVDNFPGTLSTFIPPRVGAIQVLVRFGTLPKAL